MANLTRLTGFDANAQTPRGALAIDADGNLFGIARSSTDAGAGVIYEVRKTVDGYAGSATVLLNFTGDGQLQGQLLVDGAGNLFGTTFSGDQFSSRGVVYELARTSDGYASAPTVIASIGTDPETGMGSGPGDTLAIDAAGNLFGTTRFGGPDDGGTVFEIARTATGFAGTPTILATFNMQTGEQPRPALYVDAAGNVFGTTTAYGTLNRNGNYEGSGTAFEIAKTPDGYAASPTILARFDTSPETPEPLLDSPNSGLVADAAGNLFGAVAVDLNRDDGVIFEIARTADGYDPTPIVLHQFSGQDGDIPVGGVIVDAQGNLFGVTRFSFGSNGMSDSSGTVYELRKTADGYADDVTRLGTFQGANGASPLGPLVVDGAGNLFGATLFGGDGGPIGLGTVFEVTDSGYAVACFCRGTRIRVTGGDVPVEALAPGDAVVTVDGRVEQVRWVGRRSYGGRFLAGQPRLWPIRFRAGSLGGGLPRRDLLVSPEHAIFLDGVLVAARNLVNGTTIRQERGLERVDYHHVELDRHDVLLAEGAPSESYVDDDSRGMFHNAAEWERMFPGRVRVPAVFCAARVDGGPELDAIRRRLAGQPARAA